MNTRLPPGMLFCCLLVHGAISGQTPEVIRYTAEDGLRTNSFHFHLFEDAQGFIWGASSLGAFRFDGHRFEYFGVEQGLPDRVILRFVEDPDQMLWLQTYSGSLAYLDGDSFVGYAYNDRIKHVTQADRAWSFQKDRQENLFLATYTLGLWQVDHQGQLTNPIAADTGTNSLGIWLPDSLQPMPFTLLGSTQSAREPPRVLSLYGNDFQLLDTIGLSMPRWQPNYRSFFAPCRDGTVILAHGHYLYRISREGIYEQTEQPSQINAVCEDQQGNLWVATIGGGLYFYPGGVLDPEQAVRYFDTHTSNWVMQDRDGGIWFSVLGKGVWYFPDPTIRMSHASNSSLPVDVVYEVEVAEDFKALATETDQVLILNDNGCRVLEPEKLGLQPLRSLFWDSLTQRLYVANASRIGYWNDSWEFSLVEASEEKELRTSLYGMQACEKPKEGFWVLTNRGAVRLQNDRIAEVLQNQGIRNSRFAADGNRYWLGGEAGVWYHHKDSVIFLGDRNRLLDGRIYALAYLRDRLWVSHGNHGLGVFRGDSLIWQLKPEVVPSPANFLVEADTLWALSAGQLLKMVYHSDDSIELKSKRVVFGRNVEYDRMRQDGNSFWISSNSGLIEVPRSIFSEATQGPPVYINALRINDSNTAVLPTYYLDHKQNYLQIRFTALSYNTKEVGFRYRMSGIDTDWQYASERTVQYTQLTPGTYTFEVAARKGHGPWTSQPATATFVIHPPFWNTWWFRGLAGIAVALILGFALQSYIRRATFRLQTAQRMSELELKALRAQINPHFTFNTINALTHQISSQKPESALEYLNRFARLMRMILHHSDQTFVLLEEELTALQHYIELEKMRFVQKFDHRLEVDPKMDPKYIQVPPMLIQPFVENAILHGLNPKDGGGFLTVRLVLRESLVCEVEDNGVGRKQAAQLKHTSHPEHGSKGVHITTERLSILNSRLRIVDDYRVTDLYDADGQPVGTRVSFSIPYK